MGEDSKERKPRGRKALEAVFVAVLVLGMAHSVAAVIAMRGYAMWLSIIGAALVFPVLPLGWHVFSERRRRKKELKKVRTTGRERLLFRVLAVTVVAALVLGMTHGWKTFTAIRHHSGWMIPAPASARSCEALAQSFTVDVAKKEWAGADDRWTQEARAKLHYFCVASQMDARERACVAGSLGKRSDVEAQKYIDDCVPGARSRGFFEPKTAPSCGAIAGRAAEVIGRRIELQPELKDKAAELKARYAEHFRSEVASSCNDNRWKNVERVCLDIGFRYTTSAPWCLARLTQKPAPDGLDDELLGKLRGPGAL